MPRFSNVAFVSVLLLLATGTWATINHMPAINALWQTGYGVAILVKIGLLTAALGSAPATCCAPNRGWSPPATAPSSARPPPGCCAA